MPGSFHAVAENRTAPIDTQAGSHPYQYTVRFAINTDEDGNTEGGEPRDVIVDLPPGLVGDPQAVPQCSRADFEGSPASVRPIPRSACCTHHPRRRWKPTARLQPGPAARRRRATGFSGTGSTRSRTRRCEAKTATACSVGRFDLPLEVNSVTETIWGNPADPSHDARTGSETLTGQSADRLPQRRCKPYPDDARFLSDAVADDDQVRFLAGTRGFRTNSRGFRSMRAATRRRLSGCESGAVCSGSRRATVQSLSR